MSSLLHGAVFSAALGSKHTAPPLAASPAWRAGSWPARLKAASEKAAKLNQALRAKASVGGRVQGSNNL